MASKNQRFTSPLLMNGSIKGINYLQILLTKLKKKRQEQLIN